MADEQVTPPVRARKPKTKKKTVSHEKEEVLVEVTTLEDDEIQEPIAEKYVLPPLSNAYSFVIDNNINFRFFPLLPTLGSERRRCRCR
jgi:hypothetical protein